MERPTLSVVEMNYGLLTRDVLVFFPPVILLHSPFFSCSGWLYGIQDVFNEAAERVKQLKEASNDDRLFLYGYFKQSTIGDVNIRTFRSQLAVLLLCMVVC